MPTPMKAIKSKCVDCCGGSTREVKECTVESCPLFFYRLGKNPNRTPRKMTEEQKFAAGERLKKARDARKITTTLDK